MQTYKQYLEMTGKMNSPFERLHYTCLIYLDNKQVDDLTFTTLLHNMFSGDQAYAWLSHSEDLRTLAKRITQRGR